MAFSKKGFRKIVVAEREFYWKFNQKVLVISEEKKNSLVVDFGWYDDWLYLGEGENKPTDFEPKAATPRFVSESIMFALTQGWNEENMALKYRKGKFTQIE